MHRPTVLRLMRISRFRNQQDAAAATGISRTWYSMIESGSLKPTEDVCRKLESVFGLPTSSLLREVDIEKLIAASA